MVYIFIGYSEQSKTYQLLDVSTKKTVINRDVVVDEKISFFSDNGKYMDSSVIASFSTSYALMCYWHDSNTLSLIAHSIPRYFSS